MTGESYAFLGLTALVSLLVAILAFAFLRFVTSYRTVRRRLRESAA